MDNIHVAIRLRPFIKRESENDAHHHWKAEGKNVQQYDVKGKPTGKPYTFDHVFDENETTADVFEEIAQPIISSAMDGYDGTIFAYGQTASGKTFTMQGSRLSPGIIQKATNEIFEIIENTPDREFLLRVSYAELYNEGITDLLSDEKKQLSIRENGERVYVSNLTEKVCTSSGQILSLMRKGDARRRVGETNMNKHSSRSHTIFCMIIESRERIQGEGAVKVAHLNLVDLAGSERANETKAKGARFKESCSINQSLFVLGTVINRLASGAEFVPFRDSKLTRILSSSLGGNAKTAIICTITAASLEQTQSTLQFATRAKTIMNKPVMNEVLSDDEAFMQRMKKEIHRLKKALEESKAQAPSALTDGEKEALLSQERERIRREVMKEMQEKMDYFNNMVVISKSGGTPKNQLKRKPRHETWCPGMKLQPFPEGKTSKTKFNEENADAFRNEVLNVDSETLLDSDFLDLDVTYSRKTKRQRTSVHFGEDSVFTPQEFNREMACQTEAEYRCEIIKLQEMLKQKDKDLKEIEMQKDVVTMETQTEEHEGGKESHQALHAALEKLHQELESKEQEFSEVKEMLMKQNEKMKKRLHQTVINSLREVSQAETRMDAVCEEIEEELEAEKEKVKAAEEKVSQYEAQCEELKEELKAKDEEIDKVKEDRRDLFNKKSQYEAQCEELKEELKAKDAEIDKVKEDRRDIFNKKESQAKHICELEAKLQSHLMQSKGGDTTTQALESELSAKKREMNVQEMVHTREILKLEDRIRDLENEKKFLDEKNREYRNELRREHQRAADNSVLSLANYPEAGIGNVCVFSLRAENEAMERNLKLTQKKYDNLKTQRNEQVARNSKLKQELLYWKGKYDKLKSFTEQKAKESRDSQPLIDCTTRHPGIPRSAFEGGAASPPLPTSPYKPTLQERMFELLEKNSKPESDKPDQCTTQ